MAMLHAELPGTVGGVVVVAWVVGAGEGAGVRQVVFTAVSCRCQNRGQSVSQSVRLLPAEVC